MQVLKHNNMIHCQWTRAFLLSLTVYSYWRQALILNLVGEHRPLYCIKSVDTGPLYFMKLVDMGPDTVQSWWKQALIWYPVSGHRPLYLGVWDTDTYTVYFWVFVAWFSKYYLHGPLVVYSVLVCRQGWVGQVLEINLQQSSGLYPPTLGTCFADCSVTKILKIRSALIHFGEILTISVHIISNRKFWNF